LGFYTDKIFPNLNDLLTGSYHKHRRKILEIAQGSVLELGFGSGLSMDTYPKDVDTVFGLEPNRGMIERARNRQKALGSLRFKIMEGTAESIPFDDASFDAVVSFLTLCTVGDLQRSIKEIGRVLRPNGIILFIEHIAHERGTFMRKVQDFVNPIWSRAACGCNLNRETVNVLRMEGFVLLEHKIIGYSAFPNFVSPVLRGSAARVFDQK